MAEIPEPIPHRSDLTKAKRQVFGRHIAHEGVMLDRMQRQLAASERLQKFAVTGNTEDLEATAEELADMAVSIGNEIHYHIERNGSTPTPLPAPVVPDLPPAEPPLPEVIHIKEPGKLGWPAKALIAAGALGTGMGAAALVNEYYYGTRKPPAYVDTDSDTVVETDFPETVITKQPTSVERPE